MENVPVKEDTGKKLINRTLNKCIDLTNRTLTSLNNKGILFQSDSSHGLSEFTIQLLMYNNFIHQAEHNNKSFTLEIEKELSPGKRCDIFIKTKHNDILIIELKYIKISYLEITQKEYNESLSNREKYALYSRISTKINEMDVSKVLTLKRFMQFKKSLTDTPLDKSDKYETIQKVLEDGLNQSKEYAKTQASIYKHVYYCVIIGIGYTIIKSDLLEYKKDVISNK